ncbi:MAG TPA: GNAT family N-acetyltransferase [Gaiellaceae bacterium]|jgi:ribosomal protein S18 acetylase RimI-like enzyme|nr:GNAT family N-acetyltransferase [Gaiellaceae bacterium]
MEVVRIGRERLGEASDVLARAFQDDPAWVWLLPDDARRARLLPWLFRVGFDVTAADVFVTAGPVLGAARWLPPGRAAMRVGPTLRALVTTPLRLGAATGPFLAYGRAVEQLRADVAGGPHWYLAGIGVDPTAQRQGVGSALVRPGIEAAAAAGLPTVLLTNNEANLPFYESQGFVVVREGRTPEDGPRAWAMVRRP